MLKREIKYEDYNGAPVTEVFYFNITKPELLELEVEYKQGFGQLLEQIIEAQDKKEVIQHFKRIILLAYGVKSEDGKRFMKTPQLREEFVQSAAYEALFMELATDDTVAAEFVRGILPKDMVGEFDKQEKAAAKAAKTTTTAPAATN